MDEIEDQSMLGISQREEEKLIQVKEGKGIQEEEGLTKSKFPNPNVQGFQLQRRSPRYFRTLKSHSKVGAAHSPSPLLPCRTKFHIPF